MIEGMYTAAAGMEAQQMRLDAVSNDLANSSTTGYKHNRVAFRDLMYVTRAHGSLPPVQIGTGSAAASIGRDMSEGAAQRTDRPLDVALQGPGFLAVRLASGKGALTRDGNLKLDAQGRVATSTGELVEPTIKIPKDVGESDLAVGRDGTISAGSKVLGRLRVVEVPSPGQLSPAQNNTFTVNAMSGTPSTAKHTTVLGGALEGSNTDLASAMVQMLESQRAFQLASRAIKMQDDAWSIANQLKQR